MNRQSSFQIFSMLFVVVYTLCFYFNVALFKYYPLVGEFHIDNQPKTAGPPISWYGWLAVAALVAAPVALLVPRRWADRLSPSLSWIVPALVLLAVFIYEKRWFL